MPLLYNFLPKWSRYHMIWTWSLFCDKTFILYFKQHLAKQVLSLAQLSPSLSWIIFGEWWMHNAHASVQNLVLLLWPFIHNPLWPRNENCTVFNRIQLIEGSSKHTPSSISSLGLGWGIVLASKNPTIIQTVWNSIQLWV